MKKIVLGLAVLGVAGMVSDVEGMFNTRFGKQRLAEMRGQTPVAPMSPSLYGDVEGGSTTFEPSAGLVTGEGIKMEPTASATETPAAPATVKTEESATKKEAAPKIERKSSFYKSQHVYYITKGDTLDSFIERHKGDFDNKEQAEHVFKGLQATKGTSASRKKVDALLAEAKRLYPNKDAVKPEASSTKAPAAEKKDDKKKEVKKKSATVEKAKKDVEQTVAKAISAKEAAEKELEDVKGKLTAAKEAQEKTEKDLQNLMKNLEAADTVKDLTDLGVKVGVFALQSELDTAEKALGEANEAKDGAEEKIAALEKAKDAAEKALAEANEAKEDAEKALAEANEANEGYEKTLEDTRAEIERLKTELALRDATVPFAPVEIADLGIGSEEGSKAGSELGSESATPTGSKASSEAGSELGSESATPTGSQASSKASSKSGGVDFTGDDEFGL